MIKNKIIIIALLISFNFQSSIYATKSSHKIEFLINESIITNYDIAQHFTINSILENTQITSANKDQFYKKTIDDLIDMKLKQIKIKEYNIILDDENINYYEDYYFQSKNLDKIKVFDIMEKNNLDLKILNEKIQTAIAWEQLTSGLFFHTIAISESEVNEFVKKDQSIPRETAERILTNRQIKLKSDKYLRDLKAEANIEKR